MNYDPKDVVIKVFDGKEMRTIEGFDESAANPYTKEKESGYMTVTKDYPQYDDVVKLAGVGSIVKYGDKRYILTECSEDDSGFNGKFVEVE